MSRTNHGLTDPVLPLDADPIDALCTHIRQVVTIHEEMMHKLLFTQDDVPLELAEFLEDIANTYLDFSVEISDRWLARRFKG